MSQAATCRSQVCLPSPLSSQPPCKTCPELTAPEIPSAVTATAASTLCISRSRHGLWGRLQRHHHILGSPHRDSLPGVNSSRGKATSTRLAGQTEIRGWHSLLCPLLGGAWG